MKPKSQKTATRKITNNSIIEGRRRGYERIYDSELRGFICIFGKRDGVATLYYRYRSKLTGERPMLKIGSHPAIGANEARQLASTWALEIKEGKEPKIELERKREEVARQKVEAMRRELQVVKTFIDSAWREHVLRNKTGKDDLQRVERHFSCWYEKKLSELNKRDVTKWQHDMEKSGLAHVTIKRSYDTFKSLLNYAVDQEVLEKNPLARVSLKKPPSSTSEMLDGEGPREARRPLTKFEVNALFNGLDLYTAEKKEQRLRSLTKANRQHLPDLTRLTFVDHVVPAILCCYYGGFRPSDVLGLRWEHIDREVKAINKVIEKIAHHGHGMMHFPMAEQLSEVFAIWWQEQGKPVTGYVFPSPAFPDENRRLSKGALRKPWARVKKLGGLPDSLHLYTLRHNFASQLIMAGQDLETVKTLMGHTDIQTTMKNYSHLLPGHTERAMKALSKIQGKPDLKRGHLKLVK